MAASSGSGDTEMSDTEMSDTEIRVGVVVAAYNAARYLAQTLTSIEGQTETHWRCVVVDDGSVDDTARIADEFAARDPRFSVVRQANAGVAATRNVGLDSIPATEWVAYLDSDDIWLPDALETLLAAAGRRPDAVAVYGLAEYMDEAGQPIRPGEHPAVQRDRRQPGRFDLTGVDAGADGTFDNLVVSGTIWPMGVGLYRQAAVRRAGGFDPEQRAVEDWDLFIRMSRSGPLVPVDRQVIWYRQHPAGLTRDESAMAFHYAMVRWKAWSSPANSPAQRRVARKVWLRLQARAVLWTLTALVRAVRARRWSDARAAAAASAVFTRELMAGHPVRPDLRSAGYIARFVAPRRAINASARD